jgi:putative endonuclease
LAYNNEVMEDKYMKMIQGMENKGDKCWSVYILRCGDGTLYTGVAKDVAARLKVHQCGKGAAYTKTHLPVELVYQENNFTRSEALIREAAIKRLPRVQKNKLTCPSTPSSTATT